jgi:hypothetical protein
MTVNKWQKTDITIFYSAKWPKKMTAEWHSTKLYWQKDNRLMTFGRMTNTQNNTQLTDIQQIYPQMPFWCVSLSRMTDCRATLGRVSLRCVAFCRVFASQVSVFLAMPSPWAGNTKGGSITVQLTSCLTGLETAVWLLTIFVFICKTD